MTLLLRLIFREAWYHRSRITLAVIATMAMSCMIVWLIGSIDLMILRFDQDAENYLGHYQTVLIPQRAPFPSAAQEAGASAPVPAPPAPGGGGFSPPVRVPESVIRELRGSELVMQVSGARQIRSIMAKKTDERSALRRQRAGTGTPMQSPVIIGIETTESPFELEAGRWFADDTAADEPVMEGVMGTAAAASLRIPGGGADEPVRVGDRVICRINTAEYEVRIVGLTEQKLSGGGMGGGLTPAVGAVYVSMKTAEKIRPAVPGADGETGVDYLYVRLREGANVRQFRETWTAHLQSQGIPVRFLDAGAIQEGLNRNRGGGGAGGLIGSSAGSVNGIILFSTLVSILIVFTTLSMGVSERTRVFAMLRTVGMPRWKIAVLVFGESVILSLFGWVGGMAAGWLILQWTVWLQPDAFGGGKTVSLGMTAVTTAGAAALTGSLLAAVFPAWRGARIEPLEGMNRSDTASIRKDRWILSGLTGAALLTLNPIVVYWEGMAKGAELRQFLYTYVGLPSQLTGCLLLVPVVILLAEFFLTPLAARLLCVRKELLANQLSGNLWRTLGTTAALSIGLGVYSFLEISGYSMLVPYTHSKTLPNTLVTILPAGLPYEEIAAVRNLPGVDAERFLPIALEQPRFSQRQSERFAVNGLPAMQAGAGAVVLGIDIQDAFGKRADGSRPLVQAEFQEGTLASALEKLKTGGRYCLIPDSFAFRAGLHIGDKIELVPPSDEPPGRGRGGGFGGPASPGGPEGTEASGGESVPPAGAMMPDSGGTVPGPGFVPGGGEAPSGFGGGRVGRGRGGFGGSGENILEYEVCGVVSIPGWLWMAKISGIRKRGYRSGALLLSSYEAVKDDFRLTDAAYFWFDRTLDAKGRPTVSDADLEEALQKLAESRKGGAAEPNGVPLAASRPATDTPMVKVSSREYLTGQVNRRADQVIQAAAKMPLILLAVSSLGMMGTMAASIRTRRFELGVLRSLGVTRFGLVRLILAEALLISLAAIGVSLGFGVIGGWCFIGLMRYISFFGGFVSPLTIPFYRLSVGFGVMIGLCLTAAVLPAVSAARCEPAELLRRD
ncbi:MAG: ABC transporter permease [Planctomycetaceae bacterium]|jgi:putative ABC transport system permease protein|nr:ABC transporter permease [Planctomycetaceae bacterium]